MAKLDGGLAIVAQGCALLAAIQLPGALLDYFIRSDIGPPEILVGAVVALGLSALLLRRLLTGRWLTRPRPLGAVAVAFGLAALFAEAAPVLMRQVFVEASDADILVPRPGRRTMDCRGLPRRCHEHVLNALGFRGPLPDGQARVVAFVGDSYVFGSGVGEADTLPAVVGRSLAPFGVGIVNAGIEGLSGRSFPGVIRYVRARLRPEAFVVLFKDDDLDDTDMLSRWDRFRRGVWFRLLYVLNVEPMYEIGRQAWRRWVLPRDRGAVLAADLDAIAAASAGTQLVLVPRLSGDLQAEFDRWMAAHPDVVSAAASNDPRITDAEQIPHDGHWTERGCADVAAVVAPVIQNLLTTKPTRSTTIRAPLDALRALRGGFAQPVAVLTSRVPSPRAGKVRDGD